MLKQTTQTRNRLVTWRHGINIILLKYRDKILKPPFHLSTHIIEEKLKVLEKTLNLERFQTILCILYPLSQFC